MKSSSLKSLGLTILGFKYFVLYITHHIYFIGSLWLFATALAIIVCSTRAEDGEQEAKESNRAEKRKNFKII